MKKNKREYRVVVDDHLEKFVREVMDLQQRRWKSQGGIAVHTIGNTEWYYYQAMTRRIKSDDQEDKMKKYFEYLDDLLESGIVKVSQFPDYIMRDDRISSSQAYGIVAEWLKITERD